MYYAIIGHDAADSLPRRRQAREAHAERLHALKREGRLLLAGAFPAVDGPEPGPAGFSGSLIVAEFDSLPAAQAWAEADPYAVVGVYASVEVKPLKRVTP